MSIVAVRVYEDRIEIASDSIMLSGWTQEKQKDYYAKLVEINGMVIGTVGICEESGLLQVFATTHQPKDAVVDSILEFIAEFADWKKKKTNKFEIENTCLIIFLGKVFMIQGFFIKEIKEFEAIGAGRDFALSLLYTGGTVVEACSIACELSPFCEKPLIIKIVKKK